MVGFLYPPALDVRLLFAFVTRRQYIARGLNHLTAPVFLIAEGAQHRHLVIKV